MNKFISLILLPISLIYGSILYIRNKCYDWNILKSTSFHFPIIVVGNLSLGGTGKTPHIEYLIRLLQHTNKVATLSRGYKRKTNGFTLSNNSSTIEDIGDEPLQYKLKFKNLIVAVDEKRVHGVQQIKKNHPETELVLLDDAFQHRAIHAGLNILITEYHRLYCHDNVIPSGRLREFSQGSKRADIIIVSKCPHQLLNSEKDKVVKKLQPENNQSIYFSSIAYGNIKPFTSKSLKLAISDYNNIDILLLTGIAKPTPLLKKLSKDFKSIKHIKYTDHHTFTETDIKNIKGSFDAIRSDNKIIITTEKDIMRLSLPTILKQIQDIPLYYIPIEICFDENDKKEFDHKILKYVAKNKRD